MSSSGSDSDDDLWVPLSKRSEWADVMPVSQDDGPHPVVPILYTPQFRETMDYFRAILAMDEHSPRALQLTQEVIKLNAGNYTVWHFRRLVLESLSVDLWEELKFITEIALSNYKNYQIWHHRRWTAERLGTAAKESELRFTEQVFLDDAKNYHAWSHRQWVLTALGGWEGELDICDTLLKKDIYNNSAWNQRYFVIKNSPLLGGIENMCKSELTYCENAIATDPANESPWRYLRGLYKGRRVDEAVGNICMQELKQDANCIFALDLMLELICSGYEATNELAAVIGLASETSDLSEVACSICTQLKQIDPMRALYWNWRKANLPTTLRRQ